jgi:hypothetical protein
MLESKKELERELQTTAVLLILFIVVTMVIAITGFVVVVT